MFTLKDIQGIIFRRIDYWNAFLRFLPKQVNPRLFYYIHKLFRQISISYIHLLASELILINKLINKHHVAVAKWLGAVPLCLRTKVLS